MIAEAVDLAIEYLIWHSEISIFGKTLATTPQVPMWLELASALPSKGSVRLRPLEFPEDLQKLRSLRSQIEEPFGINHPDQIDAIIAKIMSITQRLNAQWYFALYEDQIVGAIALVSFHQNSRTYARILDVDILPKYQGLGLGTALMSAGICEAKKLGCSAICLKAEADGWARKWYKKLGFQSHGLWQAAFGFRNQSFVHNGEIYLLRQVMDYDIPHVRNLVNKSYKELGDLGLNYTATYQDELITKQRFETGLGLILESKSRILATVLLGEKNLISNHRTAYLSQLAVDVTVKRNGLGTFLMDRCEDLARSQNFQGLQLDTAKPAAHLVRWATALLASKDGKARLTSLGFFKKPFPI